MPVPMLPHSLPDSARMAELDRLITHPPPARRAYGVLLDRLITERDGLYRPLEQSTPAPARRGLAQIPQAWDKQPPIVCDLVRRAARRLGVSPASVLGKSQQPQFVAARYEVAVALRRMGWSTPRIGRALGGRHHATIIHLLSKRLAPVEINSATRSDIDSVSGADESGIWAI